MKKIVYLSIVAIVTLLATSCGPKNDPYANPQPAGVPAGGISVQYYNPKNGLYVSTYFTKVNGKWVIGVSLGTSGMPYSGIPFNPYMGWPSGTFNIKVICLVSTDVRYQFALGTDYQLYDFNRNLITTPLVTAQIPSMSIAGMLNNKLDQVRSTQTSGNAYFFINADASRDALGNIYGQITGVLGYQ